MIRIKIICTLFSLAFLTCFTNRMLAQDQVHINQPLTSKEKIIIVIASLTAKGDLSKLQTALHTGLDSGLTVNQVKEVLIHLYAYCGFPRSIRGLQTFMQVLEERKSNGSKIETGTAASAIIQDGNKYERGKKILGELTKVPQEGPLKGYAAFAPVIDSFLKEHLFADIFERDVLTFAQRELVTISVISTIGNAEPMLRSHLSICFNTGINALQLTEFVSIIQSTAGKKNAKAAKKELDEVIKSQPLK